MRIEDSERFHENLEFSQKNLRFFGSNLCFYHKILVEQCSLIRIWWQLDSVRIHCHRLAEITTNFHNLRKKPQRIGSLYGIIVQIYTGLSRSDSSISNSRPIYGPVLEE